MKFGLKSKVKKEKGKFIVIDGIDGSGKATQAKLLAETLKKEGFDVAIADFPQYGKKSAGPLEEYLNEKYGKSNPYIASLLFAVDRYDASFWIREQLDDGKIVISNRYVTANAGHQGSRIDSSAERIKFFKWLDNLEYTLFQLPKPDLNLILHVTAKIAQKMVDKKSEKQREYVKGKKRDHLENDLEHLQKAEMVFLQIAELFPNTKYVECVEDGKMLPEKQIHNKIWNLVRRLVLNKK
ncbi:MAG: dTMP kinase [Candidatus Doudnabacteria bacterium]